MIDSGQCTSAVESPTIQLSTLKARHMFALIFVTFVAVPILWPVGERKFTEAAIMCASYALLLWAIRVHCLSNGTNVRTILGGYPSADEALRLALLAVPLIGLSMAGLYAIYLPLSWVNPAWVTALLDIPILSDWGRSLDQLVTLALNVLSAVFLVPIVEEILFRGFLLNRWWQKYGLKKAIIASSIAFGIFHVEFLGGTVFGLVVCGLYIRSRSLMGPILVHMSNNAIVILLEVADRLIAGESANFSVTRFQSYWWLAPIGLAIGFPWLCWFYTRHLALDELRR